MSSNYFFIEGKQEVDLLTHYRRDGLESIRQVYYKRNSGGIGPWLQYHDGKWVEKFEDLDIFFGYTKKV